MNNKLELIDLRTIMMQQLEYIVYNSEHYASHGYQIEFNFYNNSLEITYNKNIYTVSIIDKENKIYWHLQPYNGSFFETTVNTHQNNFDMILLAIFENDKLYNK